VIELQIRNGDQGQLQYQQRGRITQLLDVSNDEHCFRSDLITVSVLGQDICGGIGKHGQNLNQNLAFVNRVFGPLVISQEVEGLTEEENYY
jgi:hypothetical protein